MEKPPPWFSYPRLRATRRLLTGLNRAALSAAPGGRPRAVAKSSPSCLSAQSRQGLIRLVGKFSPYLGQIGSTLSSHETDDGVIENRQQVRSMAHAQLGMILTQGRVTSIVQSI